MLKEHTFAITLELSERLSPDTHVDVEQLSDRDLSALYHAAVSFNNELYRLAFQQQAYEPVLEQLMLVFIHRIQDELSARYRAPAFREEFLEEPDDDGIPF